jgi:hypothetical protein
MPVSHPQSEANLLASRNLLWAELQHPSLPQGRNLPNFCAADASDETVWSDKEQYDDAIDYDNDNEDDDDNLASKKFRQSYMPPPGSPLFTKLTTIQKGMTQGPSKRDGVFQNQVHCHLDLAIGHLRTLFTRMYKSVIGMSSHSTLGLKLSIVALHAVTRT